MPTRLVIFDMAGTTVRDDDAVNNCLRYALAGNRIEVTRDDVNLVMGMPKPEAIRILMEKKRPGSPAPSHDEILWIHDAFLRRMLHFYETNPAVGEIPGAEAVFRQLKAAGIKIALDTGFNRIILDTILHRLKWNEPGLLDATVASDEVEQGRPYPDLIFEAMTRTDVTHPAQVAKVGDTPSDLMEGKAAGCRYNIGAAYGSHTRKELMEHPHTHIIETLGEVVEIVLSETRSTLA